MSHSALNGILGKDIEAVRGIICDRLSSDVSMLEGLNRNLLGNTGKMARPRLCLMLSRACAGGVTEDTRKLSAALELLHNASLLHDDVADASDTRRGIPTVSSLYGPVPSVLMGDFWLSRTLSLLLETADPEWALRAFAKTLNDLSEGELFQQEKAFTCDTSESDYERIIYCKTASLFELSASCGARSSAADKDLSEAAARYGKSLGMAFQIRDDILDYIGGETGKPAGLDLKEKKITLPLLGVLKGSPRENEIRRMVASLGDNPDCAGEIRTMVLEGGGVEYAMERLRRYTRDAVEALHELPASPERDFLEEMAKVNEYRTR